MIEFEKKTWYDKKDTANASKRIPISSANLNRFEDAIDYTVKNINDMTNYWWKKRTIEGGEITFPWNPGYYPVLCPDGTTPGGMNTQYKIYYSDSVTIEVNKTTGSVYASLNSPTEKIVSYNSLDKNSIDMSGKYCIYNESTTKNGASLYYGGTIMRGWDDDPSWRYGFEFYNSLKALIIPTYGEEAFIASDNKDCYPDGWSETNDALYEYLGMPFENSRESWKMLTGWYYGDATSERLIETGCKPKLVILYNQLGDEYYEIDYAPYCYGMATEDFAFGGIQLADNGFLVGTNMSPSTNYKSEKFGYVVFY